MRKHPAQSAFRGRLAPALIFLALLALAAPAGAVAKSAPSVLTFKTMQIGCAGQPGGRDRPLHRRDLPHLRAKRRSRKAREHPACQEVGCGRLRLRDRQARGDRRPVGRRSSTRSTRPAATSTSSTAKPRAARPGPGSARSTTPPAPRPASTTRAAAPEWLDKPYGFANFLRSARFANSLYNGKLLAKQSAHRRPLQLHHLPGAALAPDRARDVRHAQARRRRAPAKTGFVIPSQDEWIKAAYYDPKGGGTYSYWKYPTNPGVFGDGTADRADARRPSTPPTGDVTNASTQPLAIFHDERSAAADLVPVEPVGRQPAQPSTRSGSRPRPTKRPSPGSLGTVGQAKTLSPWGTLDQGGNAVEWTDTITPPPFGVKGKRVWRRLHGGIANAPVYQLWLSAVGLQPQDNAFFTATYPWLGIRVGVIGDLKLGKALRQGVRGAA